MTTAETAEQRHANRRLAVDEAYRTLDEYKIKHRRIVFIDKGEKRRGGYGLVRKAHLLESAYLPKWLGRSGKPQVVAVKEITLSRMGDPSDLKRAFTKEVLVWSRLKGHPGVAKFIGFCADFDRREAWLISPWETYGNVSEFINGRELEVPEKLSLAYDTIDALEFLHQRDPPVCHGDIKSGNVLVNSQCRAVLCDFGLALFCEDSGFARLESTAGFKGSIRWCSPELLNGKPRTVSSDIYAWAWLVWEVMTGELPWEEATVDCAIICNIFKGPLGQVNGESRLRECLQLWELMSRCWSVEPEQRPTSGMCKATFEYLPHYPPIPESAESHTHPAALLANQGELESWRGNHKAGLAHLEQALDLYEAEGNDEGTASVLRKLAVVADRDSNFAKMRHAASAALEKCRSLQDDIGVANALSWMGVNGPSMEDAICNLQESLKIFRAKGNSVGVARCLLELGESHKQRGKAEEALPFLEEAVGVASGCGDRVGEAQALYVLGTTQWILNHRDQAISTFQSAHDIAKNVGWEPGLSSCLCSLGAAKLQQGSYAEAEELLRESVRVARNSDPGWRLGQALYYTGKCFRAQSRLEEAIPALEESYSVGNNLFDFDWEVADVAALIADSNFSLGRKEKALAWYDTAIAEWGKGSYEGKVSECLAAKDAVLSDMERRDEGPCTAKYPPDTRATSRQSWCATESENTRQVSEGAYQVGNENLAPAEAQVP